MRLRKDTIRVLFWQGLLTASKSLTNGYRWEVGNGKDICATKDRWLRGKLDFQVENSHMYADRADRVADYIHNDSKTWNVDLVLESFLPEDAKAILSIPIPQRDVSDRLVWVGSSTGIYTAKEGYRFWLNQHVNGSNVPYSEGWKRLWSLFVPHKIKIFLWRFCRNTILVRMKLSAKGIRLPITCPMCSVDVEHLLHLFFDCRFAKKCWDHIGIRFDMSCVEDASSWLLQQLSSAKENDLLRICTVLWGVWCWSNKFVWEGKSIPAPLAMDSSVKHVEEWKVARSNTVATAQHQKVQNCRSRVRWYPPEPNVLKVNVDATFSVAGAIFSVGMVLRDHTGDFLADKVIGFEAAATAFEAEAIGTREALAWIKHKQLQNRRVVLETDALLVVNGVNGNAENLLEVGEVVKQCKILLRELTHTSIHHVRRQANRVAHEIARVPCLANCHCDFSSLPDCLVEAILRDSSS